MRRSIFISVLLLFSFKPKPQVMVLDGAAARKGGVCGQWVLVRNDFELKLFQYNTTWKAWKQANNKQNTTGFSFFPDRDQVVCKKKLKVVPANNWSSPLAIPLVKTSGIGQRWIKRKHGVHYGVDFAAPVGTSVFAITDGTIIVSSWNRKLGNYIVLETNFGMRVVYGHLSARLLEVGEKVAIGQQIGISGNSGWSTGPHLHLEVRNRSVAINPLDLLF